MITAEARAEQLGDRALAHQVAPELRPYQLEAVARARAEYRDGRRSTLLVLATGLGKTVIAAEIIRRTVERGGRVLFLAPRVELVKQTLRKVRAVGVDAAVEQGPKRAGDAKVVIASAQSLHAKRLATWARDAFALVICDEAHHCTSPTMLAILAHFTPAARVLGLTATPDRADGAGLGQVFESIAYRRDIGDDARDRREGRPSYLAPPVAIRIRLAGVELDDVRTTDGDLDAKQLAEALTDPKVVAATAGALLEAAGARPTVVFTCDVAHAHAIAAALNLLRPDCAVAVSGKSTEDEREAAGLGLTTGAHQFVTNAQLWTEGVDVPVIACVAIVRPTKSRPFYTQMIGRGLRLADGKTDCLIIDFVGNCRRHRLVTPADVLHDDLAEDEAALVAERMEAGAVDVDQVVADARAAAAELRAAGVKRWIAEDVGDLLGQQLDLDGTDGAHLATVRQRETLAKLGFDDPPANLTIGQASKVLDLLMDRVRAGLATAPQVRLLRKFGVAGAERLAKVSAERIIDQEIAARRRDRWAD